MECHRLKAAPSRRRRIVYDTSISLARWFLEEGLQGAIKSNAMTGASTVLQCGFRSFVSRRRLSDARLKQRSDAAGTIRGMYHIVAAKTAVERRRRDIRAETLVGACMFLHETIRSRSALHLVRALRVERRRHLVERYRGSCAVVIQKYWQGMSTRRVTSQLKLTRRRWERAALVVQSFIRRVMVRACYARCKLKRLHDAKVKIIQVKFRRHLFEMAQRRIMLQQKVANNKIQSWWRNKMRLRISQFSIRMVDEIPSSLAVVDSVSTSETPTAYDHLVVSGSQSIKGTQIEQSTGPDKVSQDEGSSTSSSSCSSTSLSNKRSQIPVSSQDMFAIRIQRCFRGHHRLQYCKLQNDAANVILRACRTKISRRRRKETIICRRQHVTAIMIQCIVRRFIAVKYVRDKRPISINTNVK